MNSLKLFFQFYRCCSSECNGFGGMLFGWDIGAIGGILKIDNFKEDYNIDEETNVDLSQNIVSTLQAGCFAACLVTTWFTDRWGRRWCLIVAGLVTIVGVVMQAASSGNLGAMYAGRFFAGLGVGAASMLTPLYVSECAPRAIRGALTSFYQLFIVTGIMIAFWINYGAVQHIKNDAVYIVPLILQLVPAIFLVVGMFFSPESPRWCAKNDHWERAKTILVSITDLPVDHAYLQSELQDMAQQLELERRLVGDANFFTLWKEMWTIPGNRKRAVISILLMVCQQMTGVNAINYYAPQIFSNMGLDGTSSSLFATGIYGIVKVVSCMIFLTFAADSLGRRRSLLWTSAAQAISMFIVGIYGRTNPPQEGEPVPPFGYVAMVCIFLFAAFFQFGWGPVCWIYISEIPTARLRALNVALGAATQWFFNFIMARTVLTMMDTMGEAGYGTFFLFASFCVVMGIFTWFFIPETKGLSLEKMDELFGVVDMSEKKELNDPEAGRAGGSDKGGDVSKTHSHEATVEKKE
ncbi:quinate permease [Zalerion maritima]|uniref:Quinate permease n=1 Tax=Zalerion maritima TaxID=339359 RepID=A0AAD5RTW2_9PEZI|nr:quinate permease [Zalerion maritima]